MAHIEIKEVPRTLTVGDMECGEAFIFDDLPLIKLYEEVTDAEGSAVNAVSISDGRTYFINLHQVVKPISKIIVEV